MKLSALTRLVLIGTAGIVLGIAVAALFPPGTRPVTEERRKEAASGVPTFIDKEAQAAEGSIVINRFFPIVAAEEKRITQAKPIPDLRLLGFIQQQKQRTALIATGKKSKRPQPFRLGDTLPGGEKLTEIGAEEITVQTAEGQQYIFHLYSGQPIP